MNRLGGKTTAPLCDKYIASGAVVSSQMRVVEKMIRYYCAAHHDGRDKKDGLCGECGELLQYARHRLNKCPYGESKPNCSQCKIHCYSKDKREKIKNVMRYSGPRMIFYAPGDMFVYLARKISYALKKK
ncbi:MAG: nitrous oxide-stimulated promoter family protein [Flavobacteriales bacterium]|nr:nitrous oxide-stimulated promoter family protein [Flavobacteriales bacterium]